MSRRPMPWQISGVRNSARTSRLTRDCSARVCALGGGGLLMSVLAFLVGLYLRAARDARCWGLGRGRCEERVVVGVGDQPVQEIGQLRSVRRRDSLVEPAVKGDGRFPHAQKQLLAFGREGDDVDAPISWVADPGDHALALHRVRTGCSPQLWGSPVMPLRQRW